MATDAPKIGKAYIEIRGDSSGVANDAKGAGNAILGALKAFGPAIAAVVGGFSLGAMVKDAVNLGDELNKTSQKIGISVRELSSLKYMADLSGTSMMGLTTGIRNLSRVTLEAAGGSKEAQAAYQRLGVEFRNQDGTLKSNSVLLGDIAEKFAAMPDGATKTALAMQLLGRAGTEMIPMLNQGRAGIEAMHTEAAAFGLVIGKQFAQDAENFNDNIDRMGRIAQGVGVAIASELIPALNRLMGQFIELYKQNGPEVLENIRLGFVGIAQSIDLVTRSASGSGNALQLMSQALATIPLAIGAAFNTLYMSIAGIMEYIGRIGNSINEMFGIKDPIFTGMIENIRQRKQAAADALLEIRMAFDRVWESGKRSATQVGTDAPMVANNLDLWADKVKKVGDMANLSGTQLWEMIGALMRLSPTLAMAGLGHAVAAPTGGTFETIGGAIGDVTGGLQRKFSDMGGLGPGPAPEFARMTGAGYTDFIGLLFPGMESLGATLQQYINAVAEVDVTPIQTFGQSMLSAWQSISGPMQQMIGSMFSDAIISGLQGGGKKFLSALGGIIAKAIQMFGQSLIAQGIASIASGLWPPNPAAIGAGLKQIAAGTAVIALAGLFGAATGNAGSMASPGGYVTGGQYVMNAGMSTAPQPVNYTLGQPGGGSTSTTVINVNAMDAGSFNDFLAKSGNREAVAGAVVDAARLNHPVRDHLNM